MTLILHAKRLSAWTNDLGQSFPAEPAYRASCEECGWQGMAWYRSREKAVSHFERHNCVALAAVAAPNEAKQ